MDMNKTVQEIVSSTEHIDDAIEKVLKVIQEDMSKAPSEKK